MSTPIVTDFEHALSNGDSPPIAAIRALTLRLESSESETIMGIGSEMSAHASTLTALARDSYGSAYSIPIEAAGEMFIKMLTRNNTLALSGRGDFAAIKTELMRCGKAFSERLVHGRERVAVLGHNFVVDGDTVLVHGYSRAVIGLLETSAKRGRRFEVIVTEARPDCSGYKVARMLENLGIPYTLIVDAAVGFVMENVDAVLVGAVAILENGGINNRVGTFPLAVVAKATNTPVYVAAESFKFSRVFPLSQKELGDIDARGPENTNSDILFGGRLDEEDDPHALDNINFKNILTDYTAPEYISLIVTELGVLTPSGVSDELIKLYS